MHRRQQARAACMRVLTVADGVRIAIDPNTMNTPMVEEDHVPTRRRNLHWLDLPPDLRHFGPEALIRYKVVLLVDGWIEHAVRAWPQCIATRAGRGLRHVEDAAERKGVGVDVRHQTRCRRSLAGGAVGPPRQKRLRQRWT